MIHAEGDIKTRPGEGTNWLVKVDVTDEQGSPVYGPD